MILVAIAIGGVIGIVLGCVLAWYVILPWLDRTGRL